ncbi:MAG TPA: DUF6423 family protein [Ktedonosporobacter sp.]|jgi:hypothetical protein|nr:DUF6423 family protein [Ktedonosporobacter sp.]
MTTFRSKDVEMAAVVDVEKRLVLITGTIDTNDHDILVRVDLPDAGEWSIIKSETNLTDSSWFAWQITFGEGMFLAPGSEDRVLARQYKAHYANAEKGRLTFYDGEVRPGEAVLKMFTIRTPVPRIVMAHDREKDPWMGMTSEQMLAKVKEGHPPRPYIEVYLPVRLVNTRVTELV